MRSIRQGLSVLLILAMAVPPASAQIVLEGDVPKTGQKVQVGKIEGKIIRADAEGIYVLVKKEDVEDNYDPDTERLIDLYTDKEWNRESILLFIPGEDLFNQPEAEQRAGEEDDSGNRDAFTCYLEGKQQARHSVSTGGSWAGGFFGGVFLGLIGTGIAVLVQSEPTVPLHALPEDEGDCRVSFVEGYEDEGKSRKRSAALTGGILGTATVLAIILVASTAGD